MENDKHQLGGEESGTLVHTGEEVKNGVNSVENSLTVPPKDQNRITRWLSNSTPKCIRKRAENRKFWSMTETQEAPQLTSTLLTQSWQLQHKAIERNPVMSWASATYWASKNILMLKRILAHPQATKNKEGGLDNHKGSRHNQELGKVGRWGSSPICGHVVKNGRCCYLI